MFDPIVLKGARVLKEKAHEVPKELFGTKKLKDMLARMSASLHSTEHGVAIAANQIGLPYRMFVVRGFIMKGKGREGRNDEKAESYPDKEFINPKIVKRAKKKILVEEACLSVPGFLGVIKRAPKARVRAYDENGKRFERGGSELLAQIFQHECDHLDGTLYIDKAEEVFKAKKEETEAYYEARERKNEREK